ncbi:tetratricopeptide repeat-containing hybrid sensor histidine kinase/response regulator [Parvularcula lutaonensis]|uniref:histidine kinase n=1 Tax=Parvularcula lutaonensis TaxID=491923 RepID=A0ABV7MAH6_9PROT|nr:ATP-binding protein [Parvularcula lutaonensis]GGY37958.1 hypothetical protein GCM10007148_02780 [Parvularcula lutaonensis]
MSMISLQRLARRVQRKSVLAAALSGTVMASSAFALDTNMSHRANLESAYDELIAASKDMMMNDPKGSFTAAEQAEHLATSLEDGKREIARATALWLKGEAALRAGIPEQGAPAVESALTILERIEDHGQLEADLLLARGRLASRLSQTELAARSFFDAHTKFVELGDERKESIALQAIGSIYKDAESYAKALDYYRRAGDVYDADTVVALSMANNRGNILFEMGEHESARENFEAALGLAEEMGSDILVGRILTNIARLEVATGLLESARMTALRAHKALATDEGAPWDRFVHGVEAEIAMAEGNIEQARKSIESGFAGIDLDTTSLSFEGMHSVASEVYSSLGDFETAFAHQRNHKRLSDEAKKIASSSNLAIIGARFQFAEQQLNIERLKNERLQQAQELSEGERQQHVQRVVIAAGGVVLLFAFLAAVGAYSNKRHVARINDELSSTVDQLNDEIAQREVIERDLIKAKEEAEQADRTKSTFLATMSHELRTPMNGILGFTEVLLHSDLSEDQREQVEIIDNSGKALLTLINDILDLSQIEAGKLKLRSSMFNLRVTAENAVKLLRAKAQEKGLSLALHIDPRVPSHVNGDEDRIRQILLNLVGNSIKFTETGAVAVTIKPAGENGEIRFEVRDTGIGIPADKQRVLFQRFSQVDDGDTRRFEGSGLGLAICHELVTAMGGDIRCESQIGTGSCFSFEVPLCADVDAVVLDKPAPAKTGTALRVALVDSVGINAEIVSAMLRSQNVDVVAFCDAEEAFVSLSRMGSEGDVIDAVFISHDIDAALNVGDKLRRKRLVDEAALVFYGGSVDKAGISEDGKSFVVNQPIFDGTISQALEFTLRGESEKGQRDERPASVKEDNIVTLKPFKNERRVLIVDDVPANRLLVEAVLKKMGMETVSAENGAQALELAAEEEFGAILMDVFMPVMGGFDATRRLRQSDSRNARTTIIGLTASTSDAELYRAEEAGMDSVLSKPIDFDLLRSTILQALEGVPPGQVQRHQAAVAVFHSAQGE